MFKEIKRTLTYEIFNNETDEDCKKAIFETLIRSDVIEFLNIIDNYAEVIDMKIYEGTDYICFDIEGKRKNYTIELEIIAYKK